MPLAVAIGAPGGGEGDYLGAERYVARATRSRRRFDGKRDRRPTRRSTRSSTPGRRAAAARLGRSASGPSRAWRRSDGSWDLGAADRDILLGKGVVLGGFVGLAVIDFVALSALVFFAERSSSRNRC